MAETEHDDFSSNIVQDGDWLQSLRDAGYHIPKNVISFEFKDNGPTPALILVKIEYYLYKEGSDVVEIDIP